MDQVVPKCKGINTNQDAFNKVWNHFITNRHGPGTKGNDTCLTYNPDRPHSRCALGIMATPRECQAELDRENETRLTPSLALYSTAFISDVLRGRGVTIWSRLQTCHDTATVNSSGPYKRGSFIGIMRKNMTALAAEFNLKVPA